ncbi:hypothetical protein [Methylobacterium nodulans]|uniref:hypothetical protein n=1 Tax=Methylobacterium nodulans TaxID=114616 RepID=UPI0031377F4D
MKFPPITGGSTNVLISIAKLLQKHLAPRLRRAPAAAEVADGGDIGSDAAISQAGLTMTGLGQSRYQGCYLDHDTVASSVLEQHSEKIKPRADYLAARGVLTLQTCSRIEFYGEENALRNIPSEAFAGLPFTCIEGAAAIRQRFAEIASGIRSPILGERNIIQQLEGAYKRLDPNLPIARIARQGIDVGLAVRGKHHHG